jgi:hypothetical protein
MVCTSIRQSVRALFFPISIASSSLTLADYISSPRDIAREAYEDAYTFLQTELRANDKAKSIILEDFTSIEDIRAVVEQAKTHYETSSHKIKGVLKWLGRFSARVMYYGQVLDVLAQHHPEYVSLAWGAVKFIFMVRPSAPSSLCQILLSYHLSDER